MAIKNASDLLIYKKSPSNVAEKVKFYVEAPPAIGTGTLIWSNLVDNLGSAITDESVTIGSGNISDINSFMIVIRTVLEGLAGYTCTTPVADGDGFSFIATNTFAGDLTNTIVLKDGTSTLGESFTVTVIQSGQTSNNYEPVAHSTSASISFNNDLRDVTTKDSDGFQESISGIKSFELSTDALQDVNADLDFKEFYEDVNERNQVTIRFAERGSGTKWEGNGNISSLSMDAGVEDNVTYSVTITGTSSVAKGTY